MRKVVFLAALTLFCSHLYAQKDGYWQQQVDYTIAVSLDDKTHSLEGFEKMVYTNNSPDTLTYIWIHLWPNAYKNDKTAFSDQLLENGDTRFYFSGKEEKGYINRLAFKVNDITAETEDHPQHIDIIKLILPVPLLPGLQATITTPFHVKIPFNFSRGGHVGDSYQLTQWYPKPAVYDKQGWHPMPYLDQGEFYSEFGSFDVRITLPDNYVVAASGELQTETEKHWLRKRKDYNWQPIKEKKKTKAGSFKTVIQEFPASSPTTKTIHYIQHNIHDFAWFADKRFIVAWDTLLTEKNKSIDVFSFYTTPEKKNWIKVNGYIKTAIQKRNAWIGEYPYSIVSAVLGPKSYNGGMEYPTLTIVAPTSDSSLLEYIVAHEVGHNWFYGVLASNERQHPWLDEGLNTYYDNRYSREKYGKKGELQIGGTSQRVPLRKLEKLAFESLAVIKKDQPIATSSEDLSADNYALSAYYKAGTWLEYIEKSIGREKLDSAIQYYYQQWQFKHPQPVDFKHSLEEATHQKMDSFFLLLDKKGHLPHEKRTGTDFLFMPSLSSVRRYITSTAKHIYTVSPAVGINSYDKLMAGVLFTNAKKPANPFQFLLAPMYATGPRKFSGIGNIRYSFFPEKVFSTITLGVAAATFSINDFTDTENNYLRQGFHKLVPTIRLELQENKPRSTTQRFIQVKSFFLQEERIRSYRDTIVSGMDTTIATRFKNNINPTTLLQLKAKIENFRALYPYSGELKIEQGKNFVRAAFTGKYFFNYAKGGGLDLRLFAGKFFYTSPKTFIRQLSTDRYHLNMTGANGNEDYTYSDYFVGRNEFEGTASQQIMVRDGFFKVRTDLLADKVGRSDDWLVAINFSSTIPSSINPLSILPFSIPLKLFVDIGTYAEAWDRNANTDRLLFDAGLHLPLFKETINIYLPIFYSTPFKEYIKSVLPSKNRWLKTISFSIDISNFNLRKFNRHFVY